MTRHRCLVLVGSATQFCLICHGSKRVLVRAVPDGEFIEAPCLHCGKDHLPVAYLPAYVDIPRSA